MMATRTCSAAAFAALLLAGSTHATTWTVDDDGGPGVDFTDIPDALIVAAPGDTLLVAAGSYSPFTLSVPMTLVGDDAVVGGTLAIDGLAAGRVALSGFTAGGLEVTGCSGRVLLDRITIPAGALGNFVPRATVSGSSDVRLHRCALGNVSGASVGNSVGLDISSARVEVVDSTIGGSNGLGMVFCQDGANGWPAVVCHAGANLHLSGSTVLGGDGGEGGTSCLFFPVGGDGAPAIDVLGGAHLLVTGTALDVSEGGDGGYGENPGLDGFAAPALLLRAGAVARVSGAAFVGGYDPSLSAPTVGIQNSGGMLDQVAPVDASLEVQGEPLAGGVVTFVVHGPVGASARIRLGRAPRVIDLASSYEDRLLDPLRTISLGGIPASGEVSLPYAIGNLWPAGTLIVAQASCTTEAGTTLSQSVPLIVR